MTAVIVFLLAAAAAAFAIGRFFHSATFGRARTGSGRTESVGKLEIVKDREFFHVCSEMPELFSFDGLLLKAYLFDRSADTTVILCHSYKGSPEELSGLAEALYDRGFNILLPCCRAHSLSEGACFSMGYRERLDLIDWAFWLQSRYPEGKTVLYGWSMGASTVMASVGEVLPDSVICAVEDCGYENLYDQLKESAKDFMPKLKAVGFFVTILDGYCRILKGFPVRYPLSRSLERCRIPMLFIHGESDRFVPFSCLQKCFDACAAEKKLSSYPGAAHISSYASNPERYLREMTEFIEKYGN